MRKRKKDRGIIDEEVGGKTHKKPFDFLTLNFSLLTYFLEEK